LASKKGMALTAGIAAAIVGSSFLIWYIPQSSPGTLLGPPRADNEVIGDVYARHNDLVTSIELKFDQWKNDDLANENMTAQLVSAKSQVEQMRQELASRQPAQEWKESYDIYMQALDAYTAYLDALKAKVDGGDRTDPDPALAQNWRDLVNKSVDAMPI
jgi:hypothetical protein